MSDRPTAPFLAAVAGHHALYVLNAPALGGIDALSAHVAAVAVGVLAALPLTISALPRMIAGLPWWLTGVLLAMDGLHQRLFAAHLSLHLGDEAQLTSPTMMWASVQAELDAPFVLTLTLASVLWAALSRVPAVAAPRWTWAAVPGLLAPTPAPATHPWVASLAGPPPAVSGDAGRLVVPLTWGTATHRSDVIAATVADLRARPPTNVVLVVLESVGSLQLLRDGRPDPEVAPRLAALADHALVADQVYGHFPATVRTHVPLLTGGHTITVGSVWEELATPYAGPTLPGRLAATGRSTHLFSALYLDGENTLAFYDALGWDRARIADREPAWKERELSTWGVDERRVVADVLSEPPKPPFFLTFLTASTHHPYVADPMPEGDRLPRYQAAIRHTDAAIGALWDGLVAADLARDTLLVVVGDHGEAFADRHLGNLTHKNHLFEENIRNFLFMYRQDMPPARAPGVYGIGDVTPTLLDAVGAPPTAGFVGRSLLDPTYEEVTRFFHKNAQPQRWGLRDGRYKYVGGLVDGELDQIFDLEADPREQDDVSAEHPDMIARYRAQVSGWYLAANTAYRGNLSEPSTGWVAGLRPEELTAYGPKRLTCGVASGSDLLPRPQIPASQRPKCWVWMLMPPEEVKATYTWTPPDGAPIVQVHTWKPDWSKYQTFVPAKPPIAVGTWRLDIRDDHGNHQSATFEVTPR